MSDAAIVAALAHQRREDAGLFVMDIFERGQSEALRAWARAADGEKERRRDGETERLQIAN